MSYNTTLCDFGYTGVMSDEMMYSYNTHNYPFPSTRYQGSKNKIIDWIRESIKVMEFDTVLDAFGGTSSVSHMFKRMGKTVTYNDVLKFNSIIGKALIENNQIKLSNEDVSSLLIMPRNHPTFIEDTFSNIYYTDEENRWLDGIIYNIQNMDNEYKRDIAFFSLFQSCIIKRPYNLFHRANLYVRLSDVERSFGNKTTWDRSFPLCFKQFVNECNNAIFDNGKDCRSTNLDAMNTDSGYDLVYIDTPYISQEKKNTNYLSFYHFLEGVSDYSNWSNRISLKYKHKPIKNDTCDAWTNPSTIIDDFDSIFKKHAESKIVVSYRMDGIPSIEELCELLNSYKTNVNVVSSGIYKYALSDKKTQEMLIIGT